MNSNKITGGVVFLGGAVLFCLLTLRSTKAQDSLVPVPDQRALVFQDVSSATGLEPIVDGIRGHGAGWGDIDGDGWLDLYVGTFHINGKSNQLIRNQEGRFVIDEQESVRISSRTTGVVFADFDNDGDLDLYVSSMPGPAGSRLAERAGHPLKGCTLFRNEGGGQFTDLSEDNGACPIEFGGRSAAVLDFDGDGLLDLLVGEDPFVGYNGSTTRSSRLFRNLGKLQFEDVSRQVGLPVDLPGLGVAAADVNNDTWPDLFFASNDGGNRLFLNNKAGKFIEASSANKIFAWPEAGGDNMVCGIAFGDVNRDGWLDVVMGQHFERPWVEPVPCRLFLNLGLEGAEPSFEEVTEPAGLVPLPMKAPHVELQDFNNDGWLDISTSIVKFTDQEPHPIIFTHRGIHHGIPKFSAEALSVNRFPTEEDRAIRRSATFFERMLEQKQIIYSAPGPSGDFNNDGRLDMLLPSWWQEAPSLLLQNESPGGNWLDVRVDGGGLVNRQGIGARISVYVSGHLGEPEALLGCREMSVGYGYASGQAAIAHFGLGNIQSVDVEVIFPHEKGRVIRQGVGANQQVVLSPTE